MRNILFFQYPWRLWRERLMGVYRYAEKADWHVQVIEHGRTALAPRRAIRFWHPDGCIVEGGYAETPNFDPKVFAAVPTVFCDADVKRMKMPFSGVVHDSVQTARLAVRELLKLGFDDYAFVGNIQPREWSARRQSVMKKMVEKAGREFHVFTSGRPGDMEAFFGRICAWLRSLPKPCGVLGANDMTADLVLQACRMEFIKVPEDIAVVGIDNDEVLCEHSVPTLTSVVPDFEQSGYAAAQLLDGMMSGCITKPKLLRFGATHVVRRNSTTKFLRRDDGVSTAMEYIRTHACDRLTAEEVCALIGGSRRRAELRFKKLVGCTIGEKIQSIRIDKAKSLLVKRSYPIAIIHEFCGYEDSASLRRAFKKVTGVSLRDWRMGQR